MRKPAAIFSIAFAFTAIILAFRAQARDAREGPTEIEKCQTISKSGSYKLVNNLTLTGTTGTCLPITADFVEIDLAGFTISRTGPTLPNGTTAIAAGNDTRGIAVRNGSISGFDAGGIVRGNTVVGIVSEPGGAIGIGATGS
jgi:hypothetical protein